MKVGILIMSTLKEPSLRNIRVMKNTFINFADNNKLKHKYDFYIYSGDKYCADEPDVLKVEQDNIYKNINVYDVLINEDESVYRTFEKTMKMFDLIGGPYKHYYDFIVRINISAFLNMRLLDNVIDKLEKGNIYCNAVNSITDVESAYMNDIYARGDLIIMDGDTLKSLTNVGKKFMYYEDVHTPHLNVHHVDDVMLGITFIECFGREYFKRLKMLRYNFLPNPEIGDQDYIDPNSIVSRVKTIPPGETVSGYSWDDNDARKHDVDKMIFLNEYFKYQNYDDVKLSDVLVPKDKERPTVFLV